MVIACRRTWVEPEHLFRVLTDDGFRRLNGEAETLIGDVVIYRDMEQEISHIAIVIGKNLYNPEAPRDTLRVLSKWGADGEYEHDSTDVPELLGRPAEYWTDRRG